MEPKQLSKLTAELQSKYPNAGVQSIEINEKAGTSTLFMRPNEKVLAYLEKGAIIPKIRNSASGAVITRDAIDRTILDLIKKDPYSDEPKTSYERAIRYYYTDPLLGSVVNFLASVSNRLSIISAPILFLIASCSIILYLDILVPLTSSVREVYTLVSAIVFTTSLLLRLFNDIGSFNCLIPTFAKNLFLVSFKF